MSTSGPGHFPPPSLHGGFSVYALAACGDDVWAVGRGAGPERAAHSAGSARWQLVADAGAGAQLFGVHGTADDDVWAVGYVHVEVANVDHTYVAHRDATVWRRVPSPNAGDGSSHLAAVAAHGRDDALAVGAATSYPPASLPLGLPPVAAWNALALRWDGAQWTIAPNVGPGLLSGVCAVGPGTYWAVGTAVPAVPSRGGALVPLVARFAEGQWHVADAPGEGALFAVAATGPDDVWAVGQDQDPAHLGGPLILHHDGHAWSTVDAPATGQSWLTDVAAAAPDDVWAVGGEQTPSGGIGPLIAHFDGSAWASVDPPATAAPTVLQAVVARAGHGAWAGGFADPALRDHGYALTAPATYEGA